MARGKTQGEIAGEGIRQAVREQLDAGEPPEARRTYARLLAAGMSDDQAVEFMAAVLASEMFEMLKHGTPYDRERHENALRALPKLPWD